MATTKNLNIDQGSTFSVGLQYVNTSKSPIDISEYEVRASLASSYKTANVINFTSSIANALMGNVVLSLDSYITANLKNDRYIYDVELYKSNISYDANSNTNVTVDIEVIRIYEGIITVNPGVTR